MIKTFKTLPTLFAESCGDVITFFLPLAKPALVLGAYLALFLGPLWYLACTIGAF